MIFGSSWAANHDVPVLAVTRPQSNCGEVPWRSRGLAAPPVWGRAAVRCFVVGTLGPGGTSIGRRRDHELGVRRSAATVSLTPVERQTLLLLHQVLARVDSGEADYHEKMVEILNEGFTIEYENVFTPHPESVQG